MSTPTAAPSPTDLRAGVRVSAVSVAWTVLASGVAIVAGVADGALVLVAFGLTGLLDAVGSVTLVLHFRHALERELVSERRERVALHIVSAGLIAIGLSTAAESARRLIVGAVAHASPAGVGVAGAAVVVLGALTVAKRRVAKRLASRALTADAWLSAAGAGLAVITVAGVLTGERAGWVDPVAALVVATGASVVGFAALRREEKELT
jgi:divalent metal cation (Fe/Co/Zn/Cd) transporter